MSYILIYFKIFFLYLLKSTRYWFVSTMYRVSSPYGAGSTDTNITVFFRYFVEWNYSRFIALLSYRLYSVKYYWLPINTRGGRERVVLGPSWKNRAVCFIPSENLLMPSNIPERGFVTSPATPMSMPLNSPGAPLFSRFSLGCRYSPVIANSQPV